MLELFMKLNFDLQQRLRLYRILAKATDESRLGVKITLALEHLISLKRRSSGNSITVKMYSLWLRRLNQGYTFGRIIKNFVPSIEAMLVIACEHSGNIADGFRLASNIAKTHNDFVKIFLQCVLTPLVTLSISLGVLSFFCIRIFPSIGSAIAPDRLSSYSLSVLNICRSYCIWFPCLLIVLCVVVVWTVWAIPYYIGRLRVLLEYIPPFSIYKIMVGCSFLYAMSALSKANVQQTQALKDIREIANPYLRFRVDRILYYMNRGISFGQALIDVKLNFPDKSVIDELSMYSTQGNINDALDEIVANMHEDGTDLVRLQAVVAKYVGIALIVIVVLFLITGLFSIIKDIQAASML